MVLVTKTSDQARQMYVCMYVCMCMYVCTVRVRSSQNSHVLRPKKTFSTYFSLSLENVHADAGWDGRTRLARPN